MFGTILILGATTMQSPAIRAAKRLGLRVIVADANENALCRDEADIFEHVDLKDRDAMLAMARRYHRKGELQGVFTAGTDFSATVAFVAENLGLPGTSYESALNATDKHRMRSAMRDAGLSMPRFVEVSKELLSFDAFAREIGHVGLPVVVKPVDSMGARGVVRADTVESAFAFAVEAREHSRTNRVLVEGYIDGPEFSIDALVYQGEVFITGFADRHIYFPPFFVEMGHTIPTNASEEIQEQVVAEFRRAVASLGISNGAAKGDVKMSSDGPIIGEVAARLSGGYMSGWTYPLASGVQLTEHAIRIAMGEPPGALEPIWHRTTAERAFISIPGIVEQVTGLEDIRSRGSIAEVFPRVGAGDRVVFPRNNVEKCGNVIAVAESRIEAISAAESAIASAEIILRPDCQETDEFLFGPTTPALCYAPDEKMLQDNGIGPAIYSDDAFDEFLRVCLNTVDLPATISLPEDLLAFKQPDWSHRTIRETIKALADDGMLTVCQRKADPFSALFARALLRGGIQGARYAIRRCATVGH